MPAPTSTREFVSLDSSRASSPEASRLEGSTSPQINLKHAVEYANYHYYLKPLKFTNIGKLQLPFTGPFGHNLVKLETLQHDQYLIRCSHGLLHAVSAMELIDPINKTYIDNVKHYKEYLIRIAHQFDISDKQLINLIKIAALFHDSARLGDGEDLWDPQSAEACKVYLIEHCKVTDPLASFISDTIEFKDNKEKFVSKWQWVGFETDQIIVCDFARQLLNMADCLEVMRCRTAFEVNYLPIAEHLKEDVIVIKEEIIPNLVTKHRQKISDEGRLSKKGLIQFKGESFSDVPKKSAYDYSLMGQRYKQISHDYELGIEHLNFRTDEDLNILIDKVLRGIDTYLKEYKHSSGLSFFHQGFFKPRWHGSTGIKRAEYFERKLCDSHIGLERKTNLVFALISNHDGTTLQEHVMRSLNQNNKGRILGQLKAMMVEKSTHDLQQAIGTFIGKANG